MPGADDRVQADPVTAARTDLVVTRILLSVIHLIAPMLTRMRPMTIWRGFRSKDKKDAKQAQRPTPYTLAPSLATVLRDDQPFLFCLEKACGRCFKFDPVSQFALANHIRMSLICAEVSDSRARAHDRMQTTGEVAAIGVIGLTEVRDEIAICV